MSYSEARLSLTAFSGTLLVLCILAALPLRGEPPPKPNQRNARDQAAPAMVRFWKTDLKTFANLRVSITVPAHAHPTGESFGNGTAGFEFTNYMEQSAGSGKLEVFAGPQPPAGKPEAHPLVSQPLEFTPGKYYTVLLDEPGKAGDPPRVEVIADNDQDENLASTPAQFTVRSLVRNLNGVKVTVGDSLAAQFAPGTAFLVMRGIKPATYEVHILGTTADGKPFAWVNETDLSKNHRQTLLIYPDPYGRIRPQLSIDGESTMQPAQSQDSSR